MNKTAYVDAEDPIRTGFYCSYTSKSCNEGEKWYRPKKIQKGDKYPSCGCGEDFVSNPFMQACYTTGVVKCMPDHEECLDYQMGNRQSSSSLHADTCGHGSPALGAFGAAESCGKRCNCSYEYRNRDLTIEAGSTNHGLCFKEDDSDKSFCSAVSECGDAAYKYIDSLDDASQMCSCDKTRSGACVKNKNGKWKLSRCAISEDSCEKSEEFKDVLELENIMPDDKCMLCKNTWTCEDDPDYKYKDKNSKTCAKIGASDNSKKEKYCKKGDFKSGCPRLCNVCCSDDIFTIFQASNGTDIIDMTCGQMRELDSMNEACADETIGDMCKKTCGNCCTDDPSFTFPDPDKPNKQRDCEYLADMRKGDRKDLCKDNDVMMNCKLTCDKCFM